MLRQVFYTLLYAYHFGMIYCLADLLFKGPTGIVTFDEGKEHFWKLFTVWAHVLQQIYFFLYPLSFLPHFDEKWRQPLQSVLSYWFMSLVFPMTLYVFIMFWSLYCYNRALIFPEAIEVHVPNSLNQCVHTVPVPIVFIHMFIADHRNPPILSAYLCLTITCALYILVLLSTYMTEGKWLYEWFMSMTTIEVTLTLTCCYLITVVSLFVGLGVNTIINNKKRKHLKEGCKSL